MVIPKKSNINLPSSVNNMIIIKAVVVGIAGLICWMNYLAFKYSTFIVDKIGNNVITVIGKIMGLIIAIIGTTMVIDGLKLAF